MASRCGRRPTRSAVATPPGEGARIAELFQSEFIEERLAKAKTPEATAVAIRAAEPIMTSAP